MVSHAFTIMRGMQGKENIIFQQKYRWAKDAQQMRTIKLAMILGSSR